MRKIRLPRLWRYALVAAASAMIASATVVSAGGAPHLFSLADFAVPTQTAHVDAAGRVSVTDDRTHSQLANLSLNDGAGAMQAVANVQMFDGDLAKSATLFTVPAGKRLVIEFVTAQGTVPSGEFPEFKLVATVGGISAEHSLLTSPMSQSGSLVRFEASEVVRIYADPGTTVTFLVRRPNGAAGAANLGMTISGHLVSA